jgi:hypothetical protein
MKQLWLPPNAKSGFIAEAIFFLDSPITAITMEHKRDYVDYQLS